MSESVELNELLENFADKSKSGMGELLEVPDLPASLKQLFEIKYALDATYILAVTDPKGVIVYVNEQFCAVSKYSGEELLGKTHSIINSGFHEKGFFKSMWKSISSGEVWRGEICNRAKDGSLYWVDTTIVPLLDAQKKPYRYLAIRNEITEKILFRQALEKLSELSASQDACFNRLAGALKELLDVSYVIINEFTEDEIMMTSSAGRIDLTAEFKGQDLSGFPCNRLRAEDEILVNQDSMSFPKGCSLCAEDIHSYAGIALKSPEGKVIGSLCILDSKVIDQDFLYLNIMRMFARRISEEIERRKNQDELNVQTLFAQRLSALAAMAGGVAHELNQPLSSIRIYAQMVSKFMDKDNEIDHETTREIMEKVIKQVDRASKIITHMREFSAEKKDHESNQRVSLKEVAEHCTELIGQQLKNNYIQFVNDIDPDHCVIANNSRLEQVFINLISNSRDSVNEKNSPHDNYIKLKSVDAGERIEVYFSDSGTGIQGKVKEQLFEPFVTSKPPGSGTGLGLSICVGILKDFGATIALHKTGPDGTSFKLTFPKADK